MHLLAGLNRNLLQRTEARQLKAMVNQLLQQHVDDVGDDMLGLSGGLGHRCQPFPPADIQRTNAQELSQARHMGAFSAGDVVAIQVSDG